MNNWFTQFSRNKCLWRNRQWGIWIGFITHNWRFLPSIELNLYGGHFGCYFLCFGIQIFKL